MSSDATVDDQRQLKLYLVRSPYDTKKLLDGNRVFQFVIAAYDEETARYTYPYNGNDFDITFKHEGSGVWFVKKRDDSAGFSEFILDEHPELGSPENKSLWLDDTYHNIRYNHRWVDACDVDKLFVQLFDPCANSKLKEGDFYAINKIQTFSTFEQK